MLQTRIISWVLMLAIVIGGFTTTLTYWAAWALFVGLSVVYWEERELLDEEE